MPAPSLRLPFGVAHLTEVRDVGVEDVLTWKRRFDHLLPRGKNSVDVMGIS